MSAHEPESGIAALPATIARLPSFVRGRFQRQAVLGWSTEAGVATMTGAELLERVRDISLGLSAQGVARGDRVALLSESRREWVFSDLAILCAGAVTVPIYPTLAADQVAFILRDAGVTVAIVSDAEQRDKVLEASAEVPSLTSIVIVEADAPPAEAGGLPVRTLAAVEAAGHRRIMDGWGVAREFQEAAEAVAPEDLATIIYTSGTTGEPKGVMLTHGNLVANLTGVTAALALSDKDRALSFLPLCHGFERMVAFVYLANGVTVVLAESFQTVARDLVQVRPTIMTAVPRVFEKLHARILTAGREAGGLRRRIFDWAVRVATARGAALGQGGQPSGWAALQARLADRWVFAAIRERLGGRLRFAVSGSAPLRRDIAEFFIGAGLLVIEGYGMTETSPVLTVTPLDGVRLGSVGIALPNVELAIADDGEILARGPNVMPGYYNRPEATAEALVDGWLRTGDLGRLDADGYLFITGRKKELLCTSGGKKIAPAPIEAALRADDLVAEAVLIGEQRHFPSALVVPDFRALAGALGSPPPTDDTAARALAETPRARALYQAAVDRVNADLARYEQIKKFTLLDHELTIEAGELTPTLKVKRRVVETRYKDLIDAMYA